MRKYLSLLLILTLLLTVSSCSQQPKRHEAQFLSLFDTLTTIVAYGNDADAFSQQAQFIHDRLEEYHQLYDIYNSYDNINNIKTINDNAGIAPVKVDPRIIDMLQYAKDAETLTKGYMNVAMGSVLSIWHDYREQGLDNPDTAALPPMNALEAAAEHTDINQIILNKADSTVYLSDPEMRLDVGAIAKGYAVEQVALSAEEHGFKNGLISVGGNVYAIGSKNGTTKKWEVGVKNPWAGDDGEPNMLLNLGLQEEALVTSGIYQRYYVVDGKPYHHIIDPNTLMPSSQFEAVTILSKDSALADALSTAVFNMPFDEGYSLVASLPDVEAMWVYKDHSTRYSANFLSYTVEE